MENLTRTIGGVMREDGFWASVWAAIKVGLRSLALGGLIIFWIFISNFDTQRVKSSAYWVIIIVPVSVLLFFVFKSFFRKISFMSLHSRGQKEYYLKKIDSRFKKQKTR